MGMNESKIRQIKVQYLYHSGFRVETQKHIFIFDYYQGKVDLGDQDKKTFVFSSHSHPDHYTAEILKWNSKKADIQYILSHDIILDQKRENIFSLSPYQKVNVDHVNITAFGSTDLGVSFLVKSEDITLFHAGDLNWWYWWDDTPEEISKAETLFKTEISKIKGGKIDVAFFPVDLRLEHNYCVGADYFIQEITPKYLIPMHFGDDIQAPLRYVEKMKDSPTKVISITEKGQSLNLSLL